MAAHTSPQQSFNNAVHGLVNQGRTTLQQVNTACNALAHVIAQHHDIPLSRDKINPVSAKDLSRLPSIEQNCYILHTLLQPQMKLLAMNCQGQSLNQIQSSLNEIDYRLSIDKQSTINGMPFQTTSSRIKKVAIYALNIIIQKLITEQQSKTKHNAVSHSVFNDYLDSLFERSTQCNNKETIQRLHSHLKNKIPLSFHLELYRQLSSTATQTAQSNKSLTRLLCQYSRKIHIIEKNLAELKKHIYSRHTPHNFHIRNTVDQYSKAIRKNSIQMLINIDQYRQGRITRHQLNTLTLAHKTNIIKANQQLQRIVPRRWSKQTSIIIKTALSLVTLGIGAIVIAFHNKRKYGKWDLKNHCESHVKSKTLAYQAQSMFSIKNKKAREEQFSSHQQKSCLKQPSF